MTFATAPSSLASIQRVSLLILSVFGLAASAASLSAQQTIVAAGLSSPEGVAVDGSGNVYIAQSNTGSVLRETATASGYTQSTVASGLSAPFGVAATSAGNFYVTDEGGNSVLYYSLASGKYTGAPIAGSWSFPAGLAVDSHGHIFFPAMSILILAVVVFGFAQSYFLPGMVFAPLPNKLVHIHGAIFVSWILLLVLQNALVAIRRVQWHRTLGILGVILPPLMVVFGTLTVFDSIRRSGTGLPAELLLVGDLGQLVIFVCLIAWGMLVRRDPAAHKRLMILGTLAIIGPAINRWPFPDQIRLPATIAVWVALPALLVIYDLWSRRRVHRTTVIGYALIAAQILTLVLLASLGFWQQCVTWIRQA